MNYEMIAEVGYGVAGIKFNTMFANFDWNSFRWVQPIDKDMNKKVDAILDGKVRKCLVTFDVGVVGKEREPAMAIRYVKTITQKQLEEIVREWTE
jgi:hypothetical protein